MDKLKDKNYTPSDLSHMLGHKYVNSEKLPIILCMKINIKWKNNAKVKTQYFYH